MITRSMIAGAALVFLTAGASLAAETAAAPAAKAAAKGHKEFTDHEGNTLAVDLDDGGKYVPGSGTAKKKDGTKLDVVQIPMEKISICIPTASAGGATLCQPLVFLSDGAFFKMGNASCWCGSVGGYPVCYGGNCK